MHPPRRLPPPGRSLLPWRKPAAPAQARVAARWPRPPLGVRGAVALSLRIVERSVRDLQSRVRHWERIFFLACVLAASVCPFLLRALADLERAERRDGVLRDVERVRLKLARRRALLVGADRVGRPPPPVPRGGDPGFEAVFAAAGAGSAADGGAVDSGATDGGSSGAVSDVDGGPAGGEGSGGSSSAV